MPYISVEEREKLDGLEDYQAETAGELNYVITRLVDEYLVEKGITYETLNTVVGVLECAKLEFYRRLLVEYEDLKRSQNGEVYEAAYPIYKMRKAFG